jgi:hypothetical protein
MRRDCYDVDAPAVHASVAGCVSSPNGSLLKCSAFSLTQSAPHTMVDAGQDGPLQAQTLHRTAHTDAFWRPGADMQ